MVPVLAFLALTIPARAAESDWYTQPVAVDLPPVHDQFWLRWQHAMASTMAGPWASVLYRDPANMADVYWRLEADTTAVPLDASRQQRLFDLALNGSVAAGEQVLRDTLDRQEELDALRRTLVGVASPGVELSRPPGQDLRVRANDRLRSGPETMADVEDPQAPIPDGPPQRDLPIAEFFALERALALPLPVALGATSLFLTVGFFMARLAAVSMGREAPMLDWEAREHAELVAEVKQLTRQRNALRRADPTPAAMGPRVTAPPVDPNASFVSFDGGGKGAPQWEEQPTSPHYAIAQSAPAAAESFLESGSSSFEVRRSTVFPTWGPCEPWLQSTIQKVQDLANTFPVQARIEFDQDRGMPFTLRLERATPAMTLRATIAFVEFLASIPAPPLARIDVAPIQVDRIFYRNVMSALEPHFPDTCSLDREDSAVILKFTAPDARWARYPKLPTA